MPARGGGRAVAVTRAGAPATTLADSSVMDLITAGMSGAKADDD